MTLVAGGFDEKFTGNLLENGGGYFAAGPSFFNKNHYYEARIPEWSKSCKPSMTYGTSVRVQPSCFGGSGFATGPELIDPT